MKSSGFREAMTQGGPMHTDEHEARPGFHGRSNDPHVAGERP